MKQQSYNKPRGDKNVINAAKKSMISSIRHFYSKTLILQQIQSLLRKYEVKFQSQTVTWIYVCLLKFVSICRAKRVLEKYISKILKKINKTKTHPNNQYNQQKTQKQIKYLLSGQSLLFENSFQGIQNSLKLLFKYDQCCKKAIQKIFNLIIIENIDIQSGKIIQNNIFLSKQQNLKRNNNEQIIKQTSLIKVNPQKTKKDQNQDQDQFINKLINYTDQNLSSIFIQFESSENQFKFYNQSSEPI